MPMDIKKITPYCGIIGALLFIATSIYGGLQIDGYSFISQFISESYATGIPKARNLQYAYIASGIFLTVFGILAPWYFPKSRGIKIGFFLFAVFYGLGTVTTGYFPCDLGCPNGAEVSFSQFIHNISGFFTYAIVPFCLIGLGLSFKKFPRTRGLSKLSFVCGIVSLVFVILLFSSPAGQFIGLIQRTIELSILIWILYCSLHITRTFKD